MAGADTANTDGALESPFASGVTQASPPPSTDAMTQHAPNSALWLRNHSIASFRVGCSVQACVAERYPDSLRFDPWRSGATIGGLPLSVVKRGKTGLSSSGESH